MKYDVTEAAEDLGSAQALIKSLVDEMRNPWIAKGYRETLIERAEAFLQKRKAIHLRYEGINA